ncbi:MAG: tRNA lysidine(34) synthetase TilS [Acidobacteriia bacterium]|nr:tRNA lysidine(34) synthetase TilS [Terriglobia bacterium]
MRSHSPVYTRWHQEMRKRGLFRVGERVGVAVSGGPDSVLLLEFLGEFARELGLTLAVVHFNHHLRGAESDGDEAFVRQLAEARGLAFLHGGAEVAQVARTRRRNVEATARDLRYRFFFSLVSKGQLDKVATAHTANDQAETVLMRLLRGSSTRGLGGIYPVLDGKVVRPFLSITRPEIEEELARRKLEFRVDSSNLETRLKRNKLRQEILPRLAKEFNPRVIALLKEFAERARDDEAFLDQQARERARPWRVREEAAERIPVRPLADFPPAISRRVLRQMLQGARGNLQGITYGHVEALLRFAAEAQSGRSLALPGGLVAQKDFDWLSIKPSAAGDADGDFSFVVEVPGTLSIAPLGVTFRFKIVKPDELAKAYNSRRKTALLDPQKLGGKLRLRNWRAGDVFCPLGSHKSRKLKELFRRHKVPREQRKLWPVLENGQQIVWVRGLPPASTAASSGGTAEVLVIEEEETAREAARSR